MEDDGPLPRLDPNLEPRLGSWRTTLAHREEVAGCRLLPKQIRDHETGEDFDVIGDDDMPPYPSEEPGDEI